MATEETLLAIRQNLLKGLDKVAEHVDKGTLRVIAAGRASSPGEAGRISLGMLTRLDEELADRENRERQPN